MRALILIAAMLMVSCGGDPFKSGSSQDEYCTCARHDCYDVRDVLRSCYETGETCPGQRGVWACGYLNDD